MRLTEREIGLSLLGVLTTMTSKSLTLTVSRPPTVLPSMMDSAPFLKKLNSQNLLPKHAGTQTLMPTATLELMELAIHMEILAESHTNKAGAEDTIPTPSSPTICAANAVVAATATQPFQTVTATPTQMETM